MAEIPGYDVAKVEDWVRDNVEGLNPPFQWTQLTGGHSNLTYALVDQDDRRAVIRRPPLGQLLPKAHDMGSRVHRSSGAALDPGSGSPGLRLLRG